MPDDLTNEQTTSSGVRHVLRSLAVASFVTALTWFVVRRLGANYAEVSDRVAAASMSQLILAFLSAGSSMTLIATGWTVFLRRSGHTAAIPRIVAWYFAGEVTKYLPGGLWAFIGRGELAADAIGRRVAYRTVTHSLLIFFALATLPSAAAVVLYTDWPLLARMGLCAGLLGIYPAFSLMFSVTGRALAQCTTIYGAAWVMIGVTTYATGFAVGANLGLMDSIIITSAAWLVGFGVFFVPGGIGIRESTFVYLTTGLLDQNDALAIAIITRILFILADVIGAVIGTVFDRRTR